MSNFSNLVGYGLNKLGQLGGTVGSAMDKAIGGTVSGFMQGAQGNYPGKVSYNFSQPTTQSQTSTQTSTQKPAAMTTGGTSAPAQPVGSPASIPGQPQTPTNNYGVPGMGGIAPGVTNTPEQDRQNAINSQNNLPQNNPGDQPNTQSGSPFINSLNTQQNYASGPGNTAVNTAQGTLQGIASNQTPQVTEAQKQYSDFAKASPFLLSDVRNNPNVAAEVSVGRGQALGQTLSAEQQALGQNVSNALAGESQQIGAAQGAGQTAQAQVNQQQGSAANVGSLTQPQAGAAFFGNPVTGGLQGSGNQLIDNAVGNALGQVMNGSTTSDAMATLSSLGAPAQQAFISAMKQIDPNWSITGSNATAQQNWQQIQSYQQEGSALTNGLSNLNNISQAATSFLQKTQLNPSQYPELNQGINEYIGQLTNPVDKQTLTAVVNDIQKFQSQILSANSGQTPTANTQAILAINPMTLNVSQLISTLNNLEKLGGNQLSVVQKQISDIRSGGSKAYAGNPTGTNTNLESSPNNNTLPTASQFGQGIGGTLMNTAGGLANALGAAASIFK